MSKTNKRNYVAKHLRTFNKSKVYVDRKRELAKRGTTKHTKRVNDYE